ncbi:spore germination protein [Oceanobacillus sp. CAU 1775]
MVVKNKEDMKQINMPTIRQRLSLENIKKQLNNTDDLKSRDIQIKEEPYIILYISPLVDQEKLESKVIEPLTKLKDNDIINVLISKEIKVITTNEEAINGLLEGNGLLIKRTNPQECILLDVAASIGRTISEPIIEKTVLGPHEGFVENIDNNIYLLRKRVKTPRFTVKKYTLGNMATTDVCLVYIDELADPKILKDIEERIQSISLDYIRSPGEIQDCVEDQTFSPFPQLLDTELPGRASANLKEGKIVLIVDGNPKVLILPATFVMFLQSPDDYTSRWELGSFFRFLRFISYFTALILPALYIAIVTFHYEIIPIELVYSFQSSLSYVPFRPVVELMTMQLIFELLREASIRLPSSVASTFGIVGAIVVGTAMVEAGFVSYGGLTIVALTAVSSFVQPNMDMGSSIRVLGFPLMILAATLGFLGIMIGVIVIMIHFSRITSFGVPYFTPFAPLKVSEFKDTLIRSPIWLKKEIQEDSTRIQKRKMEREWKLNESEDPY